MTDSQVLKTTPLLANHKELGARLAPFGGWLIPIQYSGIIQEHNWTRKNAGLFDICHMGEFIIEADQLAKTNPDALRLAPLTMPVKRLDEIRAARQPNLRWKP